MLRRSPVAAAALAASCVALALLSPVPKVSAQETPAQPAATLKVDTNLVIVPVVVRDKKGALVRSLRKEDFTVTENGKPQSIRYFDKEGDAPLTVGLLVDVSGSQRNVLDEERTASSAFLDTLLRPDRDKAFVVQFGHQADLLADVTGSLPKLEAGLKKLDADTDRPRFNQDQQDNGNGGSGSDRGGSADSRSGSGSGSGRHGGRSGGRGFGGGGTVLYDAIFLSSDEVIKKQANRKALILLTDGNDRGSKESLTESIEAAQRANATVYAIYFKGEEPGGGGGFGGGHRGGGGFPGGGGGWPGGGGGWPGGGGGHGQGGGGRGGGGGQERTDGKKILERICDETGGRMFEVSKKEPVDAIYKQISEELRSEYRLGFTPTDPSDGYHHVILDLPADKKSSIQTREGYYVGAGQ